MEGIGSKTTASHTCSFGSANNSYAFRLMKLLKKAEINFISCPTENIYLQGRQDTYPKRRVHQGMRMVVEDLHDVFGGFTGVEVSGKTGTAQQVETRPNHALFVGYAPSSDPEITIATRISYGYSSHNAAAASRNIISYYYNLESLDNLLAVKAEGVNASGSSARTD